MKHSFIVYNEARVQVLTNSLDMDARVEIGLLAEDRKAKKAKLS